MKSIKGIVISGNKKGRNIGFPTANISLDENIKSGVYSGTVYIENEQYKAALFISNMGKVLEAHILDFSGNLYEKEIEVELGKKIRDVQKFDSDEQLIDQIRKDVEIIRKMK